MPPQWSGRAKIGSAGTEWERERQQGKADAGPVQDGDGGHDSFGRASVLYTFALAYMMLLVEKLFAWSHHIAIVWTSRRARRPIIS